MEKWKQIKGYEGIYEISNYGRVKSVINYFNRLCSGSMMAFRKKDGYYAVGLRKDKIKTTFTVHRLVALHFNKNPLGKPHVNHIDCDKLNNNFKNLEWCTPGENNKHARLNNLCHPSKGEENGLSKLTNKEVLLIFNSVGTNIDIAKKFNISPSSVGFIKIGKTWTHITGKKYVRKRFYFKRNWHTVI